jgi:hypothetical protein
VEEGVELGAGGEDFGLEGGGHGEDA